MPGTEGLHMGFYIIARHAVAVIHILQGIIPAKAVAVHHAFHQAANIQKADLILQEQAHSFLVGTVCGAGAKAALADRLFGGCQASATSKLRCLRAAKSSSGTGLGRRSGQVRAYWIGMRISGTPS